MTVHSSFAVTGEVRINYFYLSADRLRNWTKPQISGVEGHCHGLCGSVLERCRCGERLSRPYSEKDAKWILSRVEILKQFYLFIYKNCIYIIYSYFVSGDVFIF